MRKLEKEQLYSDKFYKRLLLFLKGSVLIIVLTIWNKVFDLNGSDAVLHFGLWNIFDTISALYLLFVGIYIRRYIKLREIYMSEHNQEYE